MAAQGDSTILEEAIDENYEPTEDEILEYAKWLGMDEEDDQHLFWIAREGLKAPLPENWKPCKTGDGEIYYFNFSTGESVWDHPCDEFYRKTYDDEKQKPLERQQGYSEWQKKKDGKKDSSKKDRKEEKRKKKESKDKGRLGELKSMATPRGGGSGGLLAATGALTSRGGSSSLGSISSVSMADSKFLGPKALGAPTGVAERELGAKKAELEATSASQLAEWQAELDAQYDKKRKAAEEDAERQLKALQKSLDSQRDEAERKKRSTAAELEDELSAAKRDLSRKNDNELEEFRASLRKKRNEAEDDHDTKVRQLRGEYDAKISAQERMIENESMERLNAAKAQLETDATAELKAQEEEVASARQSHREALKHLEDKQKEELQKNKKNHEEKMSKLKQEQEEEVSATMSAEEFQVQKESFSGEFEKQLEEFEAELSKKRSEAAEEHDTKLRALDSEFRDKLEKHEKSLQAEHDSKMEQKQAELNRKLEQLEQAHEAELQKAQAELASKKDAQLAQDSQAQAQVQAQADTGLQTALSEAKAEILRLSSEIAQATEREDTAAQAHALTKQQLAQAQQTAEAERSRIGQEHEHAVKQLQERIQSAERGQSEAREGLAQAERAKELLEGAQTAGADEQTKKLLEAEKHRSAELARELSASSSALGAAETSVTELQHQVQDLKQQRAALELTQQQHASELQLLQLRLEQEQAQAPSPSSFGGAQLSSQDTEVHAQQLLQKKQQLSLRMEQEFNQFEAQEKSRFETQKSLLVQRLELELESFEQREKFSLEQKKQTVRAELDRELSMFRDREESSRIGSQQEGEREVAALKEQHKIRMAQLQSKLKNELEQLELQGATDRKQREADQRRSTEAELEHAESLQRRRLEEQKAVLQAEFEERKRGLARQFEVDRELEEQRVRQQKELLQMQSQTELASFERNLRQQESSGALSDVTPMMNVQKQVEAQVERSLNMALKQKMTDVVSERDRIIDGLRHQIQDMEVSAISEITQQRKKLSDDVAWQTKVEERIRNVESRESFRPDSRGSNRPESAWGLDGGSTGGSEGDPQGQMMKVLADMLNNQSARDRALTTSLEELRREQSQPANDDRVEPALLRKCLDEIESLKSQLHERSDPSQHPPLQPHVATNQGAWAHVQQDSAKLAGVRSEAEAVKHAMAVVKDQKKKLQARMRELSVSREEWKADMSMCADEPSGLHRGFLHGVKEALDGLAHKMNDKARKLQQAASYLKLKRKQLALEEASLQSGGLDMISSYLPADLVDDPAVKSVIASPQPMRHDMLRKCVQNIEKELYDLAGGLSREAHTGADKNFGGFKTVPSAAAGSQLTDKWQRKMSTIVTPTAHGSVSFDEGMFAKFDIKQVLQAIQ